VFLAVGRARHLDAVDIMSSEPLVVRVTTNRMMGPSLSVGFVLPAYCSAAGRVLLGSLSEAELDSYLRSVPLERLTPQTIVSRSTLRKEIRKAASEGWYLTDQETDAGVRSLAAPLRDANNQIVAALNVSCYSGRVEITRMMSDFLLQLLAVASAIGQELKASRFLQRTS